MELKMIKADLFNTAIYDNNEACVVVFSRHDCHVCKEVVPRLEEVAEKYQDKLSFYAMDVEQDKALFKSFSLKGVPQLLFFKDGEFYGKLAGDVEEDDMVEKIEELI
ncbi:co-chaperone YbbN [Desulfosporosinus sp. BICA1-9]|uniref:thioredoxin family protein n=1 Tax=Desulfosporosinus sp. BICA1-9 TaxID=1531958 RepID=UPI00054B20AB|nr:thioredoxin family protein [Desulfosporosinus sp. BICA1-9]KJS49930.1 MAG: thioredoxin [Peptococcaceae bacterium BRH_c23]KJS87574.1 MAG: thioredoxin [Desulfosporosinus sp. BICA1-9]HBW36160.1 thioredoxin [Desulfosporosinus sp.]